MQNIIKEKKTQSYETTLNHRWFVDVFFLQIFSYAFLKKYSGNYAIYTIFTLFFTCIM